jgi:hypothetical protein
MRLRIPSRTNLFRYLQYDLHFRLPLKSKHIIQKCLAVMGTSMTDAFGGPHDFLPPRSDEFQKLCSTQIIISLKICKERSDWIILLKLTNQNNSITYFEVNCKQTVIFITGSLRART